MDRRQLAVLFVYSLVIWTIGNAVLPLLPLFAGSLGADYLHTGLYLAAAYASIAAGTTLAGWLSDRKGHRKAMMLLAGLAGSPFVLATALVQTFPELVVLTCVVWWLGGMAIALTNIVGGLSAGPGERGRVLGVLALAAPVGSVIGGLSIGSIADALGFSRMWIPLGLLWLVCPAVGLFVREVPGPSPPRDQPKAARGRIFTPAFLVLLACGISAATGSFIGSLGRSLLMQGLKFTDADITSTVLASGLVTLPFPVALGTLSDRVGRLRFIGLCYMAGVAGLVVYASATSLWAFWTAASLLAFVSYVSPGVSSALVVDLVDRPAIGRGLSVFSATGWVGAVIGFGGGGLAFERLGYARGFLVGALLVVVAMALLAPIAWLIRTHAARAPPIPDLEPRKE